MREKAEIIREKGEDDEGEGVDEEGGEMRPLEKSIW